MMGNCGHLLFPFRQVHDAAGENEVVAAHYRDDARDGAFVFASAHCHKLTACRRLDWTLSEHAGKTKCM